MEENIVDEFTISLKNAEEYVESIIIQRIVRRMRKRWKDAEWMHMRWTASKGLWIDEALANQLKRCSQSSV